MGQCFSENQRIVESAKRREQYPSDKRSITNAGERSPNRNAQLRTKNALLQQRIDSLEDTCQELVQQLRTISQQLNTNNREVATSRNDRILNVKELEEEIQNLLNQLDAVAAAAPAAGVPKKHNFAPPA